MALKRRFVFVAFVLLLLVAAGGFVLVHVDSVFRESPQDPLKTFPKVMLWAWERPEHLSFIDPEKVGVAFLARTIQLRGSTIRVQSRHQPLEVPPDTRLMTVVRIESDTATLPTLSKDQLMEAVRSITELVETTGTRALQIDFDASSSERPFYRDLLWNIWMKLPSDTKLSITALASWCLYDTWLEDVPINEAVPMLFRMGKDGDRVMSHLKSGGSFTGGPAGFSVGISTDEPIADLPKGRRLYVFNPKPWSRDDVTKIIEETKRWQ